MKRFVALLLTLMLLIPCAIAEAPVDVAALSDADLKALYAQVKTELMDRKLWDAAILPAGVYQAGKTLPEGTYECIAKGSGYISIYKNYDSFMNDDDSIEYFMVKEGESFVLSLYGDVCYFVKTECSVRPFVGLSW